MQLISDMAIAMMAAVVADVVRREHGKWVQKRLDKKYEKKRKPDAC